MRDWSDIVRCHGPLVWRTAYRLLSNEADASDCYQDTFLSAVELSQREEIRHWPAVLKQLATARALDRMRQRYRQTEHSEAWPDDPIPDTRSQDPALSVAYAETSQQLRLALTKIDPRQAEVFCLVFFEEWSYRQVAAQLQISVSHAGVLLHRAKERLQELLVVHRPTTSNSSSGKEDS